MSSAALALVEGWPARASAGWLDAGSPATPAIVGPQREVFEWASVTKVLTAVATWVAVEEGTVAWDDPAGPPGASLAHLLAHASGLAVDSFARLAPPGRRRIYSNTGIEAAADHLARRSGIPASAYIAEAVLDPLGMDATVVDGSPAHGARGPLCDLLRLAGELLRPSLVAPDTIAQATSVTFPGLDGVLPGFGLQSPNDWGLGVEIRGSKRPHWTGSRNSGSTFGHFGRRGGFVWVDPEAGIAAASLSDRPFGAWAAEAWPELSDAILAEGGGAKDRPAAPQRPA